MSWNNELIKSAEQGNLEKVKECLANGVSANVGNGWALRNASQNGYFEIVKYLVENGANVKNSSALRGASEYGHLEIVKYLVENGADVNVNDDGKTAIELAENDKIGIFLEKN